MSSTLFSEVTLIKKYVPGSTTNTTERVNDISEVSSLVSSVVIENDNNIVLDFSTKHDDDDSQDDEESDSPAPGSSRSDHSSTSLLSKVIKVTLSCMILMMNDCC